MPSPMTLRDVATILDKLRKLVTIPQVAKTDVRFRVDISRHINYLKSLDIEATVIESYSLGQIGNIQADTVRNYSAEILSRIYTFSPVFSQLDKDGKLKSDEFDEYDINHLFDAVNLFEIELKMYKDCLMAAQKIPFPKECEVDKHRQEVGIYMLGEARENWLKGKRKLLKALQQSLEFDEYLDKPKEKLYQDLRNICHSIYNTLERYFPPCEIKLHPKLQDAFIEHIQKHDGSYVISSLKHKNKGEDIDNNPKTESAVSSDKEQGIKRNWDMELFPMILMSELYDVCSDVFDSTETQFHSSLNLHCKHEPIKIRPKQKIKACYLISKLYDIVPAKHKAAWREDILAHLDIQWSYYEKKYCNPRGDDASLSSREYADEIDKIFKNHKKRA